MNKIFALVFLAALLTASPAFALEARLSWTDNSDNEDGFIVEKRGAAGFAELARTAANVALYADQEAASGDCYRVRAYNAAGVSAPSNVACLLALPGAPSGLTVTVTISITIP